MDILFDFATAANSPASVIGTMTRPLNVVIAHRVDLLGVRFRPGALSNFMSFDGVELLDARVDLANFWGRFAEELCGRLSEAAPINRISVLETALARRANARSKRDPFVEHCVKRIETANGALRIADLERSSGLTSRQIERKFARCLGISPKMFSRIIRFKRVAAAAGPRARDWAGLAAAFGFADQPHLVREFKAFSGSTPVEHFAEAHETARHVEFIQDVQIF